MGSLLAVVNGRYQLHGPITTLLRFFQVFCKICTMNLRKRVQGSSVREEYLGINAFRKQSHLKVCTLLCNFARVGDWTFQMSYLAIDRCSLGITLKLAKPQRKRDLASLRLLFHKVIPGRARRLRARRNS